MRWRYILPLLLVLVLVTKVESYRISKPPTLVYPLTGDQVGQLNEYLYRVWELTKGEFNFDIESTSKSNADNGDMWFLTGLTAKIQFKMGDSVYSINVD